MRGGIIMNNYLDLLSFRHACKAFDSQKQINNEDKRKILEFARLSPSSFGLEPWHFLAISNPKIQAELRAACWNQEQITSSSLLVAILSYRPHVFRGETDFIKQRMRRKEAPEEQYNAYSKMLISFLAAQNTQDWAKRQSYIALSNMLTGAASLGIDSCPIEGFAPENVYKVLKDHVDWDLYDITAIATFGYRINNNPSKIRENQDSVITWI
jgi:nitroreductase